MWSRIRSTWLWVKWTVYGWFLPWPTGLDEPERPGDDDQFARWIDDNEI